MSIGKIKEVEKSEFYPNGKILKCKDCLYGSHENCPTGVLKLCGRYLGWLKEWVEKYGMAVNINVKNFKKTWDQTSLFEIIDNIDYYFIFEEYGTTYRSYTVCTECGYIPRNEIDDYKCVEECASRDHFVQSNYDFSLEEIRVMKEDKQYSDWMTEEMEQDLI